LATGDKVVKFWKVKIKRVKVGGEVCALLVTNVLIKVKLSENAAGVHY